MEITGRKRNHSNNTSTPLRSLNANSLNIKRWKSHNEPNEAILADEVQKNETAITSWTNDRDSNEENIMSAAEVTMKHSIESQPSKASNKTQPSKTSIESQPSKSDKVSDSKKPASVKRQQKLPSETSDSDDEVFDFDPNFEISASVKRQQKLPSETSDSDDEVFDFDPNFEISASVKRTSSPKTQIETCIITGKHYCCAEEPCIAQEKEATIIPPISDHWRRDNTFPADIQQGEQVGRYLKSRSRDLTITFPRTSTIRNMSDVKKWIGNSVPPGNKHKIKATALKNGKGYAKVFLTKFDDDSNEDEGSNKGSFEGRDAGSLEGSNEDSGGLTLSSGSTLNGAIGAIDEVQVRDQDITELVKIVVGCADWEEQTRGDVYNCVRQILDVKIKGEQKALIKTLVYDLVNQDSDNDDNEEDDEDQTSFQPIPCTQKADPQGYAQLKDIVTSMIQNREYPNFTSVVEKHPNLERKYKRTSLSSTIKRFRNTFQPETNDKAVLKDNESDDNEEISVEKLTESIRSEGFNIQSNRPNAVPQEINIAALVWVQKNGVHKSCKGPLKDALQKEILEIIENIGFDMSGRDLDLYVSQRLSWARSLSGLPNTRVGPKKLEYNEMKRKEDQEFIDLYLKLHDPKLFNLRESKEAMEKVVDKFVNSFIPELGMTFDEAVKNLTLTFYVGITGQVKGNADTEAYRWTQFNDNNNRNPVLVNADGTGIGKTGAERDYGFNVLWVHESICFDNVALFEKTCHLKYQHLPLGRERCWRVAGAGQRSSIVRGQYKVFITYSTEVQSAIDARKVVIRV